MKPEEKAAFATSLFPPNFSLSNSPTRRRTVWTRPAQCDTAGNVAERVIGWQYQLGSALKVLYRLLNTKKRTANPPVNLGLIPSRRCAVIVISSSSSPAGWSLLFTSALVDQQYFSIAFLSSIIVTVFLSFFFTHSLSLSSTLCLCIVAGQAIALQLSASPPPLSNWVSTASGHTTDCDNWMGGSSIYDRNGSLD